VTDLQTFFHMGGYALYVWPSFLISFLVLLANVMYSKSQYKRVVRETAKRAEALAQKKSREAITKKVNP